MKSELQFQRYPDYKEATDIEEYDFLSLWREGVEVVIVSSSPREEKHRNIPVKILH